MRVVGPDPESKYPIEDYKDLVFLKHVVDAPNIIVGDYTYFDDALNGAENFEKRNVLYNYHPTRVKLEFGKFCAIAAETRFMMSGDHKLDAISTYPFPIFQNGWESSYDIHNLPIKGDIIVGNDVWFGYGSTVKNGVTIGNGAIIAAGAVVVKDVPAYSIVGGNPAKVLKTRFDSETIDRLEKIAWWDWDIKTITESLPLISTLDVDRLEQVGADISN